MTVPASAVALIDRLVAPGSWVSWDQPVDETGIAPDYADSRRRARQRSGADESVLTGTGTVGGVRLALIVSEFGFLGGSIGRDAGERIVAAIARATAERIGVLALPASGGTRMQEGTPAFLQMTAITAAVSRHRRHGLPYLVYLRHPTTGGVYASWGSLGQLTWAEPDALVGFLGPKVYAGLYGRAFPEGVQRAEHLREAGVVDDVFPVEELPERAAAVVALMTGRPVEPPSTDLPASPISAPATVWEAVIATRERDRPGLRELLAGLPTVSIRDRGPIWLGLARLGEVSAVLIGQDRAVQQSGWRIVTEDLELVGRGIRLAAELRLPLLTVIDTPGAELSVAAEESGLAPEIARATAELLDVPVPTVSLLLGEGAGGAALALFPADRVLALPDTWLAPLPPEGAGIIVTGDPDRAAEVVAGQQIWARELQRLGIVDEIVDHPAAAVAATADYLVDRPPPRPEARIRVAAPNHEHRIVSIGAIAVRDGRVLLVHRAHEPQRGRWTIPGGKVEPGEAIADAVIREMAEETGLAVTPGEPVEVLEFPDGRGNVYEVHQFRVEVTGGELRAGDDALDARWVSAEELDGLPVTETLADFLARHGIFG